MDALLNLLPRPLFTVPSLLLVIYFLYTRFTAKELAPPNVPWIGRDPEKLFSETRAHFGSFSKVRQYLGEGYEKYAKKNKSYILPDFSGNPELLVPTSQIPWLLDQPDSVLSVSEFHYKVLEGDYCFTDPQILRDPYHEHVIHKYLPRRIAQMIPEMWEELSVAVDRSWGTDTKNWKSVSVLDNMMFIIPRITNRMFVGLPLCRNDEYLSLMTKFAMDVIKSASIFLRFTPQWMKPVVGRIVTIPNTYHFWKTTKFTLPLIHERLALFKRKAEDPDFKWEAPNDYLTWHISLATAENRQDELVPEMIARRLMPINFAAIHTTAMTMTNVFLDLIAADPSIHYIEGIREEVTRVLAEEGGQWTKAGMARCHRADSAIRESMRVSNFMTRNVLRRVMVDGGIENKDQGWWAPKGTFIGLDMHSVQHDPAIYPSPETYDAFRFSRPREDADAAASAAKANGNSAKTAEATANDSAEVLRLKNTGLVTTSETFLPFGHGRHACPGRFFVSLEMKMMLAYMALYYEVEPLATRPANQWFGQNCVPPSKAAIRVRRRAKVEGKGI